MSQDKMQVIRCKEIPQEFLTVEFIQHTQWSHWSVLLIVLWPAYTAFTFGNWCHYKTEHDLVSVFYVLLAVCYHLKKRVRTLSKYFSSNFIFICKQYFTQTRSSFCRLASFHWRQCFTFVSGHFCKNAFWIGVYGCYWHLTKIQNTCFRWNKGIWWRGQWKLV